MRWDNEKGKKTSEVAEARVLWRKKGFVESNLTGQSDHKFLTGLVMVSSHTPGGL